MDEDVSLAAVRHDEAIALGGVEPFDPPGDFDQPDRAFVAVRRYAPPLPTALQIHRSIRPPLNASALTFSPPMNLLRVAIGTIRSGPAKTAEIRNASDSLPKIANRSALNIGNTRNLSVAVDRGRKKSRRAATADGIIQLHAAAPLRNGDRAVALFAIVLRLRRRRQALEPAQQILFRHAVELNVGAELRSESAVPD